MSLFDLQDVCIAIGSIATLDLPMVVDLIGIYGLKGPYCTLTTTDWFLQALSVIPRGSWGDVARRFTMIRWAAHAASLLPLTRRRRRRRLRRKLVSGQLDVENPFVLISSGLLVQPDEGVSDLVVDRIGLTTSIYREEPDSCNTGWSQAQVPERLPGTGLNITIEEFSRHDIAGASPDVGRMRRPSPTIACGAWPHAAAPSAAPSRDIVRQGWRAARRSSRNNLLLAAGHFRTLVAQPCANAVTSSRPPCEKEQQLVGAAPCNTCAKQQQLWPAIARPAHGRACTIARG
ncbi:hypothetical protein F511_28871 [Dorcoceras hygrometricum]|uniref:Acyl-CoA dehydrogenase-related protein n=1 Tax=Dorcoceras hygrometricum TaxID=472368 RepID=A0A2Z7D3E2_9LAMI|nr:hypothetical protein F511_28871 [Dorcoceras hygrometricum]